MENSFEVVDYPQKTHCTLHLCDDSEWSESSGDSPRNSEMELPSPDISETDQGPLLHRSEISIQGENNHVFKRCKVKIIQGVSGAGIMGRMATIKTCGCTATKTKAYRSLSEQSQGSMCSTRRCGTSDHPMKNENEELQPTTACYEDSTLNLKSSDEDCVLKNIDHSMEALQRTISDLQNYKNSIIQLEEENRKLQQENDLLRRENISLKKGHKPTDMGRNSMERESPRLRWWRRGCWK